MTVAELSNHYLLIRQLHILTGMFALKWSKTRLSKIIWFMIALFMFTYAANIAINKG